MSTERKGTEKIDDEAFERMLARWRNLEATYRDMPKDDLVNLLVFKDAMAEETSFCPDSGSAWLWLYVADETGLKYLSNERPKLHFSKDSPAPIYLTEGDVEIRVPKALEGIFPDMKPGDLPVRVKLNVGYEE